MQFGCVSKKVTLRPIDLMEDERIKWGCSFIGCPSYIELMEYRLKQQKLQNEEKYLPKTFLKVLERDDPGMILRCISLIPEPLRKKPILVLAGKEDKLVPWTACETFIAKLGEENPNLNVIRYDGVGHEVNHPGMLGDFRAWALQFILISADINAKLSSVKI
jgi:Dienelactone hydrolase family